MILSLITVFTIGAFAGKQDRPTGSFTGIEISSAIKVVLTQGNTEKLTLEGDDDILQRVITETRGNKLIIKLKEGTYNKSSQEVTAYLTFKTLSSIELSGAVNLNGTNEMNFNDLEFECSGATKINLHLNASKLDCDFSGASNLSLEGSVQLLNIDISGASKVNASDFVVKNCNIDCSGASYIAIHVTDKLRAEGSGASKISYKGNPSIVESDMSGASKMSKM
ncbi:MAG: hypothetical protein FD170_3124 [Bacteroidetes bacterium]|nr:MAG: hypothetical protein FD170_3124 [Bacteroidota bacterium]